MSLAEYDYALPPELIAQAPSEVRDLSRLLVADRATGALAHRVFRDLPELVRPGDALVLNDTRVLHARLRARREETGGAVELLLLRPLGDGRWEAFARPARRLRDGDGLLLASGARLVVGPRRPGGGVEVTLPPEVAENLEAHGELPLPPYIRAYRGDEGRYQTVYARDAGSVAAPTAGLHLTPELLAALRERGVAVHAVTLHVGAGTFGPMRTERIDEHRLHAERYLVPAGLTEELCRARAAGGRVIAVGTTAARALESAALHPEHAGRWSETALYIRPGHEWRLVDGLVTNFHLPRTSLLVLVAAFAGRALMVRMYEEAVRERYRFYSFGDAGLIL